MSTAAVSYTVKFAQPYPSLPPIKGYKMEVLLEMGWISPQCMEDPTILAARRAFESLTFKQFVDREKEPTPITSVKELKGVIYVQWTRLYCETECFSTDKPLFKGENWARAVCPPIVARLFPKEKRLRADQEPFLRLGTKVQRDIVLRLNHLCQVIAQYDESQVDQFLIEIGFAERESEWLQQLLDYAVLGKTNVEALFKLLREKGVVKDSPSQ